jgi:hypothetical protein
MDVVLLRPHDSEERNMQAVTTTGLDIAKSAFQVHGVDAKATLSSSSAEASACSIILREIAAAPRVHRGLRLITSLVA